jgi:hypothetical protein
MDVYASQKIKVTVKSVGSLILVVFYSSLVDFYYIAPYIHNILAELKFLVKSKLVSSKLVDKIFMDVNTMMFDTISFFNGFNRFVIKDDKKHLSGDVIFNERIFLNLRGVKNSNEIMNMTRERCGSKKYNELIKSQIIKPKVKTDVKIREPKKYGDEVKLEKNDGDLLKFLSFKRATKRNLFLGKDINLKEYSEYQDDYIKTVEKLKTLEGGAFSEGKAEQKKDDNIMEVFDFINNVTNTDKNKEVTLKELSFWGEGEEQNENKRNEDSQLTFGFDFESGGIDKNKKKEDDILDLSKKASQSSEINKIDSKGDKNDFSINMNIKTNSPQKDENKPFSFFDNIQEDKNKGNNNNNNQNNNNPVMDFFDFKTKNE